MNFKGCQFNFPSEQTAQELDGNEMMLALINGDSISFDVVTEDGSTMCLDQIICGMIRSFYVPEDSAEAIAVISFDETTMPAGLRGGKYKVKIGSDGLFDIPEGMYDLG